MLVRYTLKALSSVAYLLRRYNDIDVYVEDSTCRNVYRCFINRVLKGKATVTSVIDCGGRDRVIERCSLDVGKTDRRRLYIIDADLDLLTGAPAPSMANLFRINAYCFENLIITEAALVAVSRSYRTNEDEKTIRDRLDYTSMLEKAVEILTPLFVIYAVAYMLSAECETVGYSIYKMCEQDGKSHRLSRNKVEHRVSELRERLSNAHGKEVVAEAEKAVAEKLPTDHGSRALLISGKDYLLPLTYHHLRLNGCYEGRKRALAVQLSQHCELDVDPRLPKAIRSVAASIVG